MACKDCKGTGKYQPFYGPTESCRACQGAFGSPDLQQVDFESLWLSRPVEYHRLMQLSFIQRGYMAEYPISYKFVSGQMLVIDGNVRVAALRYLKAHDRNSFNRILPDGLIPARETT